MSLRPAVFLDRDGTLIEDMHYLSDPSRIRFLPGVDEALRKFQAVGYCLVIVTNQSGIGRGRMTAAQANAVNARLVEALAEAGVRIDASYICPHSPGEGCECRKPRPGLLYRAAKELSIDLALSVMIGDKYSDVAAGAAARCATVLVNHKPGDSRNDGAPEADVHCDNWAEVSDWFSARHQNVKRNPS